MWEPFWGWEICCTMGGEERGDFPSSSLQLHVAELIPETDTSCINVDVHQPFWGIEGCWLHLGEELAAWKLLVATGGLVMDMGAGFSGWVLWISGWALGMWDIKGCFPVPRSFWFLTHWPVCGPAEISVVTVGFVVHRLPGWLIDFCLSGGVHSIRMHKIWLATQTLCKPTEGLKNTFCILAFNWSFPQTTKHCTATYFALVEAKKEKRNHKPK